MTDNSNDWVADLLDGFSEEFDPSRKLTADSLEDGEYTMKVVSVVMDRIAATGEGIVRWLFEVVEGPSCVGADIERVSFLRSQVAMNMVGSDCALLLGTDTKTWKNNGIPFSRNVLTSFEKLPGRIFAAKKKATVSQNNGKTYHNINVVSLKSAPEEVSMPF